MDLHLANERAEERFLVLDVLSMEFVEVQIKRDPQCPVCGEHPTVTELMDYELFCGLRAAPKVKEVSPVAREEI